MLLLSELIFRPVLSPGLVALLAVALAALAVAAYGRTIRDEPLRATPLLVMRIIIIAVLAGLLMGPSVVPPAASAPDRPRLTVLLDTSRSMTTRDVGGNSRIDFALNHWLSPAQRQQLAEQFDLRLVGFDRTSRTLPPSTERSDEQIATGESTNYADAITNALLDVPAYDKHAALVVIGDGHDSQDRPLGPAADLAADRSIPIHTVTLGSDIPPRDIAVVAVARQDYLMAGEKGEIVVRLYQVGFDDETATVRLEGPEGTQTATVRFNGAASARLELPIQHDEPGSYEYMIEVEPIEGERVTTNNQHVAFVDVTEQRIRVLLLEGAPYWDTRFLAQSLRADRHVELVHISQISSKRRQAIINRAETQAQLPRTATELGAYDVVVLGSGLEHLLSPEWAGMLDEYVWRRGGHVVFARGRAYDPGTSPGRAIGIALSPLEPVIWGRGLNERMPMTLTPAGRSTPPFSFMGLTADAEDVFSRLPPLTVLPAIQRVKPAAVVLAHAGKPRPAVSESAPNWRPPAIAMMNYGRGSVFAILGEGLWQWAMLPPGAGGEPGLFGTFWSNVVRWLTMGGEFQPGEQVSLKLGRSSLRLGEPLLIDVATRSTPPDGFNPVVRLISPEGRVTPIQVTRPDALLRRMQATITPPTAGVWRVVLDAPPLTQQPIERKVSVYDLDLERLQATARPDLMADLSSQSGGMALNGDTPVDLAARLQRHQAAAIVPAEPQYIWDTGVVLAAVLMWMGLEWLGRRQAGWL